MSTTSFTARPVISSRHSVYRIHTWLASPARILPIILLMGASLRFWMLTHDVPTLNSDEATIGLMGLHMLHGQWTTFYWGQEYMGSLEALLTAPFLALFGATAVTLRLATMLVGLAFVATIYLVAVRLYDRRVALLSATLLALGPPFFVVLSMRALGGYPETLLFGNVLLLLASRGASPASRFPLCELLLGGVSGLALWTDPLILPYFLAVGALFWMQRRADLRGRNGLVLGVGFIAGASPAILYNIMHGAATVAWILGQTPLVGHDPHGTLITIPGDLWQTLMVALPILAGSTLGGTQVTGLTPQEYLARATANPAPYVLALLLVVAALALGAAACIRAIRGWRALRTAATEGEHDAERMRRQGEAALLLVAVSTLVAFCIDFRPDIVTAPRYLLPLYVAIPVVVAQARRFLRMVSRQSASRLARLAAPRRAGIVLALIVCGWFLTGNLALTPRQTAARDHGIWVAGTDHALLDALHADNVHTVISNDYWEGLRLTFESGETIISVMMTSPGHLGFNRYPPYVRLGRADCRPAYVELTGTQEAVRDAALLRAGQFPGYSLLRLEAYTVLLPSAHPPSCAQT